MTNVKKSDQEPSIEEILESIRQIISDEGEPAQQADAAEDDGNVLDLTEKLDGAPLAIDMVEPEPPMPARAAEPAPMPEPEPEPPAAMPEPPAAAPAQQPPAMDALMSDVSNSLMSDKTAAAATEELSKLMAGNVSIEKDSVGAPGKVTLEDIATELMRPLLKQWLDQNLPGIIEKLVQREIEKLSRRAGN